MITGQLISTLGSTVIGYTVVVSLPNEFLCIYVSILVR